MNVTLRCAMLSVSIGGLPLGVLSYSAADTWRQVYLEAVAGSVAASQAGRKVC